MSIGDYVANVKLQRSSFAVVEGLLDFTVQNRFLFHLYIVIVVHVTGKVKGNIEFTEEMEAEANKWIEENLSFTDLRFPSK